MLGASVCQAALILLLYNDEGVEEEELVSFNTRQAHLNSPQFPPSLASGFWTSSVLDVAPPGAHVYLLDYCFFFMSHPGIRRILEKQQILELNKISAYQSDRLRSSLITIDVGSSFFI